MMALIVSAAMVGAVCQRALRSILSNRCINRPISESRAAVAIVADKNFLGVNRAPVAIAAYVDCIGGSPASVSAVRAGFGVCGGSHKGERTDGDGDDCFFHD